MAEYRLYFLDDRGHIREVADFVCDNDEEALAAVDSHRDGRAMELWNLDRRIRDFPVQDA